MMQDFIIIEKIKKMLNEMTIPEEVDVITKYAINAIKTMRAQGSKNINLLKKCLPYGIWLRIEIAELGSGNYPNPLITSAKSIFLLEKQRCH